MKYRHKNNEDLGRWALELVLRLMYENYADTRLFGWSESTRPMLQFHGLANSSTEFDEYSSTLAPRLAHNVPYYRPVSPWYSDT